MNSIMAPVLITLLGLTLGGVSLTTNYWLVTEVDDATLNMGLWKTCLSNATFSKCVTTEFYGDIYHVYQMQLNAVRALMVIAEVATLVALVTGIWLSVHRTKITAAFVAMGCDLCAMACLAAAVGVSVNMARDFDKLKFVHASFGLAIVDSGIVLLAAILFMVTKDTHN